MYERTYGYRYDELGDHPSAAEIAKAMRADIKTAQAEGLLPKHWTYSVRSDHGSMHQSVDIRVRDCPDAWQTCDGTVPGSHRDHGDGISTATACPNVWCKGRNDPAYAHGAEEHEVLTEEAQAAKMTLQRIHSAYNHDGSDIMIDYFDVRYYGVVEFEDASSADFRRREKERLASRKAAREGGTPTRLYRNFSRDGSHTVHLTVTTAEGKEVLACGARLWRSSVGDMHELGSREITCSRCAKKA